MAKKLKAWRNKKELAEFLEASEAVAFKLYIAQELHNDDEMKRHLFAREDLRIDFFDKFELNADIACEIEKVDRRAWEMAREARLAFEKAYGAK